MTRERQGKDLSTLRTKKAFKVKKKPSFIIFNCFLIARNGLRPEIRPLKLKVKIAVSSRGVSNTSNLLNYSFPAQFFQQWRSC